MICKSWNVVGTCGGGTSSLPLYIFPDKFGHRVGVMIFTEEVRLYGNQSVKLAVSWELDMERYVGEGCWCYAPLLVVSTPFRPGFEFIQIDAFVKCAA